MNRIEKAKEIVASFLKVKPTSVNKDTVIDNSAIHSSVLVHRMHAVLAKEGFKVENTQTVRTFGEFLNAQDSDASDKEEAHREDESTPVSLPSSAPVKQDGAEHGAGFSVGIDIEDVENMPRADDYRDNEFYSRNFSDREISYCILQPDIRKSFAGKFAAKEAVVKADNSFKRISFKETEILNDSNGRPVFGDFNISISHTEKYAIAVAVKSNVCVNSDFSPSTEDIKSLIDDGLSNVMVANLRSKKISAMAILISLGAACITILAALS